MEEYDKRVTAMYNDCWKLYRDYTKSHDMRQFNEAKDAVIEKYGRQCDVIDLVLWIAIRVQTLHDMGKGKERWRKLGGTKNLITQKRKISSRRSCRTCREILWQWDST